jgi:hypothetical protein
MPHRRLVGGFPPRWPGFHRSSGHVGFIVDKAALGQVRFPLPVIPPTAPQPSSSSIVRCWYNRPSCGQRTNGTLIPAEDMRKKLKEWLRLESFALLYLLAHWVQGFSTHWMIQAGSWSRYNVRPMYTFVCMCACVLTFTWTFLYIKVLTVYRTSSVM